MKEDFPSRSGNKNSDKKQEPGSGEHEHVASSMKERVKSVIDKAVDTDKLKELSHRILPGETDTYNAAHSSAPFYDQETGVSAVITPGRFDSLIRSFLSELASGDDLDIHGEPSLASALLDDAWQANASDIHLDSEHDHIRLRLRIDGILLDIQKIDRTNGQKLINQFKAMALINPDTKLNIEEGRFTHELEHDQLDLRVLAAPCINGPKLTVRLLMRHNVEQQFHELGLSRENREKIETALETMSGMFLAAGPTGSGKTTTLYSLLHKLKRFEGNIVTIEDPVEYSIDGVNQIQVDEQHDLNMASGGKALLRLDPDCMLLGEIRDADSAWTAFNAAASGRILLSSIHSHEAVGVISVLRNYGISNQDIAANLNFVIAQRLVRKLCMDCRREEILRERDRKWFDQMHMQAPSSVWYPQGCKACKNIGFYGRTGVFEVWMLEDRHYEMILNNKDVIAMRREQEKQNHKTLIDEALDKLKEGVISPMELRAISGYGPLVRN
ncbi:MAG: Flp pilus assembly complex ATPase component TadA [Desulfobulbaceae bacterium]|nr:Flp pilus assembly complex ATPase component TadA [Desulfobulbaceae bacterium]